MSKLITDNDRNNVTGIMLVGKKCAIAFRKSGRANF